MEISSEYSSESEDELDSEHQKEQYNPPLEWLDSQRQEEPSSTQICPRRVYLIGFHDE